ncbi:hypothetical protein Dda_1181 [Drechslerella dactyloides]|uniref:Alpha/beta hydrolase fold-3 domain-containing protein n=1 Tax=Drechslerella dactyloides TaxID=74499 RepID=A0AAD6J6H0_DREDA|nr:hypothetical protein Dda_1181 [Drechslerella dactyloides]
MPDMNTFSVAGLIRRVNIAATTPTVISVGLSHFLNKAKHRGKPTYHLGYHQGLQLVRRFLIYASHRTVEELQAFTAQYVPVPSWVHVEEATIDEKWLDEAAEHLVTQLGPDGVERVGGRRWWRWRVKELKAEWIEMRKHYNERMEHVSWAPRTMLYVHGGLQDILASYLYLLSKQPASTIILSGDSAGGGAIAALLCILRDQGIPLPAGSILISPWVDLTHSFPSVIGDNSGDYIPAHGFLHKSSPAWPPPTDEDIEKALEENRQAERDRSTTSPSIGTQLKDYINSFAPSKEIKHEVQGFDVVPPSPDADLPPNSPAIPKKGVISIMIDGQEVRIKDQIQLYTTNELLSHPLVSPVLQGSLGGLPPMMILVGGSEVLRDEQIYFAHKAANPRKYPPPSHVSNAHQLGTLNRWKHGTDVVLQVFDDCCHVTPTLSFTKPAKYMYRSIARFGDWLFAREAIHQSSIPAAIPDTAPVLDGASPALHAGDELFSQEGSQIVKGDTASVISSSSSSSSTSSDSAGDGPHDDFHDHHHLSRKISSVNPAYHVPNFVNHMVRQRVDTKGNVHPLPPPSELPCMQLPAEEIGCIKPEPVRRWMEGKKIWDSQYAKAKKNVQMQWAKEIAEGGYLTFEDDGSGIDEKPPPSALVGRRRKASEVLPGRGFKPSYGLKLWSMIGSKQDAKTIVAEEKIENKTDGKAPEAAVLTNGDHATKQDNRPSSSSSEEVLEPLKKTQSQIDRLEAIASVPDAVLVDSPPAIVDVTAPYDKLGRLENAEEPQETAAKPEQEEKEKLNVVEKKSEIEKEKLDVVDEKSEIEKEKQEEQVKEKSELEGGSRETVEEKSEVAKEKEPIEVKA